MKSRQYILIITIAVMFMTQGCEDSDFLNTRPLNAITAEDVFSDPALARANLLTIYGGLPKVFGRGTGCYPLDFSASDLNNTYPNSDCRNLRNNDYDASNISSNLNYFWRGNYSYIYQANIFIEGIEGSEFDENTKKSFIAEARALRAVFYFELYRFYGGVPIITTPISLTDDSGYNLTRNTRDELADFIINEFTESAEELPVIRTGADMGRIEKGAVLGMKARILLTQASLKNDATLFQQAAVATRSVIDLNRYSLYPDYEKLFLAKSFSSPPNNEYILFFHYVPNNGFGWGQDGWGAWSLNNVPISEGGWGGTIPSLNLVDEFEMIDGQMYTESPLYDPLKPYDNRDPRFYASIFYQGTTFKGKTFEFWEGGKDYDLEGHITTGFFIKKGIDETVPDYYAFNYGTTEDKYDPYLRYADILLMYAEAQNEFGGPDASVYEAINMVRERAGMPFIPEGLTKVQMRDKIRHERHVELNMEESFYHDIRRWGTAVEMSNRDIWGHKVIRNQDGSFTFERAMIEERTFNEKYIFFPIPQSEINKNSKLVQNPGY